MTVAKKPAAKKTVVKKPVAKKVVVDKPVAKKVAPVEKAEPVIKRNGDGTRVLYTIRLEPTIIEKIKALAVKMNTTHAAVARTILAEGV